MNNTNQIDRFKEFLISEEKSTATVDKYIRDVMLFLKFSEAEPFSKALVLKFKDMLIKNYAPASVNSMLAAVNCFLSFTDNSHCKVKQIKIQKQIFAQEEKELSVEEYKRLVKAANGSQLSAVMQTICETGIRVSELSYITVEAVMAGKVAVNSKNKTRIVFIPKHLQKLLKRYIKKAGITAGTIFVTKAGKPLNRSNIWKAMKALCHKADVNEKKVFPHNLRHLFARMFYNIEKDIVRLADIMGHSSINTTRICTVECGKQHIKIIDKISLLLAT